MESIFPGIFGNLIDGSQGTVWCLALEVEILQNYENHSNSLYFVTQGFLVHADQSWKCSSKQVWCNTSQVCYSSSPKVGYICVVPLSTDQSCHFSVAIYWNFFIRVKWPKYMCPPFPGEGDSYMKQTGMLVISLRGVNFGFWSRLGCSGQSTNILSHQGLI